MIKRLTLGILLAAGLPAAAQQGAVHTGSCAAHGNDQVRCALRIPMVGNYTQTVALVTRGDGRVSGQAQVWLSECGLPGSAGPVVSVTNAGTTHRVRQSTVNAVAVACPELFVFNCRESGQAVPCQRAFGNASIRVEQQQR